jgi:hypothetical protein
MESFENQVNQVLNKARDDAGNMAQVGGQGSLVDIIVKVAFRVCMRVGGYWGPGIVVNWAR